MEEALFGNEYTAKVDRLLTELWKVDGWPHDPAKDRALLNELVVQYPGLNLQDELFKFRGWIADNGTGKEVTSRGRWSRVRNWCSRAATSRRGSSRPGSSRRRTSTAARPAEAFGAESSNSLSRW